MGGGGTRGNKGFKKGKIIKYGVFSSIKISISVTFNKEIHALRGTSNNLPWRRPCLNLVPSVIVASCIMHNVAKFLQDPDDFPEYVHLLGNIGNPDVDDVRIQQRSQERRHQFATIIHENDNQILYV